MKTFLIMGVMVLLIIAFFAGCAKEKTVELPEQEIIAHLTSEDLAYPDFWREGKPYVIIPVRRNGKIEYIELEAIFYQEPEPNYKQLYYKHKLQEEYGGVE